MNKTFRALVLAALTVALSLMLAACGNVGSSGGNGPSDNSQASGKGPKITVGSKEYTEQVILGYILEYTLAAAGADVRDLTGIVGSRSTRGAQLSGQVDVAYESPMAIVNRHLADIETVFLLPDPAHALVSSSLVRQVAALGGDVSPFVPPVVASFLDTGARGL